MEWHEVGIIEKKKMHSNIQRPFHLQLFLFWNWRKSQAIWGHCYHLDRALNFRASPPIFSSPGFLPFQRTKSIKSCCYLYSGSMQRPVMVQKPLIKTLGKQKQSWFRKQPQRANGLSFKNSFSEIRINFTARNDGSPRCEFQKKKYFINFAIQMKSPLVENSVMLLRNARPSPFFPEEYTVKKKILLCCSVFLLCMQRAHTDTVQIDQKDRRHLKYVFL